jgi:hypothetical protein
VGVHRASQEIEISAPPEACFAAAVDYETFPRWQDAVKRIEVLSRDGDGLGELVEVTVDAKLREITYRLNYRYERPHRIWWDFAGGDIEHIDGELTLAPTGAGCLVTDSVGVDPGVPVPGIVMGRLNRQVMARWVRDLRDEVERRAG